MYDGGDGDDDGGGGDDGDDDDDDDGGGVVMMMKMMMVSGDGDDDVWRRATYALFIRTWRGIPSAAKSLANARIDAREPKSNCITRISPLIGDSLLSLSTTSCA